MKIHIAPSKLAVYALWSGAVIIGAYIVLSSGNNGVFTGAGIAKDEGPAGSDTPAKDEVKGGDSRALPDEPVTFTRPPAGSLIRLSELVYRLSSGTVTLNVSADRLRGGEFRLQTKHGIIIVKGTTFTVSIVDIQDNSDATLIYVSEGSVSFSGNKVNETVEKGWILITDGEDIISKVSIADLGGYGSDIADSGGAGRDYSGWRGNDFSPVDPNLRRKENASKKVMAALIPAGTEDKRAESLIKRLINLDWDKLHGFIKLRKELEQKYGNDRDAYNKAIMESGMIDVMMEFGRVAHQVDLQLGLPLDSLPLFMALNNVIKNNNLSDAAFEDFAASVSEQMGLIKKSSSMYQTQIEYRMNALAAAENFVNRYVGSGVVGSNVPAMMADLLTAFRWDVTSDEAGKRFERMLANQLLLTNEQSESIKPYIVNLVTNLKSAGTRMDAYKAGLELINSVSQFLQQTQQDKLRQSSHFIRMITSPQIKD